MKLSAAAILLGATVVAVVPVVSAEVSSCQFCVRKARGGYATPS